MHIVFMGTPDFAVPSLEKLAAAHSVDLVVTRPDAARGRGKKLLPSAVKARALELGLPVLEAARITPEVLDQVTTAANGSAPDVIVVAAFGCLLPQALIDTPRLECVNVHASLLPTWRGAAPIQRGILAGDPELGVSIMRVVKALDAGPYCAQASLCREEQTAPELMSQLAELGATTLLSALVDIEGGTAIWHEQDESQVTYAKKITKAEMFLSPELNAQQNRLRVQAAFDAAPARTQVAGRSVRVLDARAQTLADLPPELTSAANLNPGQVLKLHKRIWLICAPESTCAPKDANAVPTKNGETPATPASAAAAASASTQTPTALELLSVKPDGKREMPASAWAAGLKASGSEGLTWASL